MQTAGLSLEQAPPLSVPASFFLAVPASMILAGGILSLTGADIFASPWHPRTVLLAHAGTLGVLLMGMIGALYQMIPVVAGAPVPAVRVAHLVQLLLLFGVAAFVWRLVGGPALAMTVAGCCLGIALMLFLLPVGWSLAKPATRNETTLGMRIAIIALAAVTTIGLIMARGYAGAEFPANRFLWTQAHLTVALAGWVGGLIMSVSWQVVPMFYVAPAIGTAAKRWMLAALVAGLVLPFAALIPVGGDSGALTPARWAALLALPAALVVWLVHPLLTLHSIARRKRRRKDASLLFWHAGLVSALLLVPLAIGIFTTTDARWPILFGWLAIWGWGGMIMHGMLTRIAPFLVWFHRITPLIGREPVPSIRGLLSQRRIRLGFAAHLASLAMGAATIVSLEDSLAYLTGILLVATGVSLGGSLYTVLWRSWRPD